MNAWLKQRYFGTESIAGQDGLQNGRKMPCQPMNFLQEIRRLKSP
ncbi:MAG: hypothetical protein JWQ23_4151, partial [Herminiimonas sp.]|nr:hypothetical protein [Herminiimonas sp.]